MAKMINVWVASDSTKPAGAELGGTGMQHTQHQPEGEEVEQRADRAENQHEAVG